MEMKRPRSSDENNGVNNGVNNNDLPADLCEKKRKTEDPSDVDNDRPAAHSTELVETRPARLNSSEMEVNQPSDDVNNNDRPVPRSTESAESCRAPPDLCQMTLPCDDGNNNDRAAYSASPDKTCPAQLNSSETKVRHPSGGDDNNNDQPSAHSTGSGLGLLSADGWCDVFPNLSFYENAMMRFASRAMNRLIRRSASTLPLRVIAGLVAGHTEEGYRAYGFEDDKRTPWRDLVSEVHASPESMLQDIFGRCGGHVLSILELRDLPFNDAVMEVMAQRLPYVAVSEVIVVGIASGHERVHRLLEIMHGLRSASLDNDVNNPNAAAFLAVCATRRIPNATLNFAADVTEEAIIEYLFNFNCPRTTRQFGIPNLRQSLSKNFFGTIVERCRRCVCKSMRFGMAGILADPTDAKYERFVVERDANGALYKFDQKDHAFYIVVGTNPATMRFYISVLQGDANDLCTSVAAARVIPTYRVAHPPY